jgi:hypothetical protein
MDRTLIKIRYTRPRVFLTLRTPYDAPKVLGNRDNMTFGAALRPLTVLVFAFSPSASAATRATAAEVVGELGIDPCGRADVRVA